MVCPPTPVQPLFIASDITANTTSFTFTLSKVHIIENNAATRFSLPTRPPSPCDGRVWVFLQHWEPSPSSKTRGHSIIHLSLSSTHICRSCISLNTSYVHLLSRKNAIFRRSLADVHMLSIQSFPSFQICLVVIPTSSRSLLRLILQKSLRFLFRELHPQRRYLLPTFVFALLHLFWIATSDFPLKHVTPSMVQLFFLSLMWHTSHMHLQHRSSTR